MIETIESRFSIRMTKEMERGSIDYETAKFLAEHPHVWPFFFHSPESQVFVPPYGAMSSPAVEVRVNWNVWQTRCPFCPSAQHASRRDHYFFCADCMNMETGGCSVPVIWPDDVEAIEAELEKRPYNPTRNWEPGETVDDLVAETLENMLVAGGSH